MSGKGDARRPSAVDAATFAANWHRAFARAVEEMAAAPVRCDYCGLHPGDCMCEDRPDDA